ncbi:hypothetical protein E3N88_28964 [Mikania micrantha]|uniref:Uncharacterized protein n=1 Tax=Mikania micrantha TaxID=192012 RepID=A0A5N6N0Z4_9ASTR|nr:hypothetical protein E3N88_28964 [Mikania micrantha]
MAGNFIQQTTEAAVSVQDDTGAFEAVSVEVISEDDEFIIITIGVDVDGVYEQRWRKRGKYVDGEEEQIPKLLDNQF